jgi:hypothetical protein
MQIDVFALLAEARQRLNATVTAAEAKRDFWLAQSELTFVVFGGGSVGSGVDNTRPLAGGEGEGSPH